MPRSGNTNCQKTSELRMPKITPRATLSVVPATANATVVKVDSSVNLARSALRSG